MLIMGLYLYILASVYDSLSILWEIMVALALGHSHPEQTQGMNYCVLGGSCVHISYLPKSNTPRWYQCNFRILFQVQYTETRIRM